MAASPFSMPERGGKLGQVGRQILALLPSRQRARSQRADHLRDVEASDRAVLEIRGYRAADVRHDRALACAGGAHGDLRLQLAVELVEAGNVAQQRQGAHAGEIAAHQIGGRAAGDVDVDFAAGLAAIGAEIRNRACENAAGERGVGRGRRKMRTSDVEFGGRKRGPRRRHSSIRRGRKWRCSRMVRKTARKAAKCGDESCEAAGAGRAAMSSRWKSRSSFTSGLLAISTDAQPLKAPSPIVPARPLIITTGPLSRTSALADSGACNIPGASSVSSTGTFCRSIGGAGTVALMSNVSGCSPARALPVRRILRSAPATALASMPSMRRFEAVAQAGKHHRAVGHRDVPDGGRGGIGGVREDEACVGGDDLSAALRSRSSGTVRTGRTIDKFGDLGAARPYARQRHVGLDAADGQAKAGLAIPGRLERDVVQRHVERRPQADPGRARNRHPVSGLALDPVLDRRGQEARGDSDDQEQRRDDNDGGDGGAGDFQGFHVDLPDSVRRGADYSAAGECAMLRGGSGSVS